MSDDPRYPCCEHCDVAGFDYQRSCFAGVKHRSTCPILGCPGSVPVGPTREDTKA